MTASDIINRLRRIGVEVDLAQLGELTNRDALIRLYALALEHPRAFTDPELLLMRTDHDFGVLDRGGVVFCPNFGAFSAGPPRSYHGRAPRNAWIPQLSTRIVFYSHDGASTEAVFEAWRARFMPEHRPARPDPWAKITNEDIRLAGSLGDPDVCEHSEAVDAWCRANNIPRDLNSSTALAIPGGPCSPMAHDWIINTLAEMVGRSPLTVLVELVTASDLRPPVHGLEGLVDELTAGPVAKVEAVEGTVPGLGKFRVTRPTLPDPNTLAEHPRKARATIAALASLGRAYMTESTDDAMQRELDRYWEAKDAGRLIDPVTTETNIDELLDAAGGAR
jgi:hypothetical protein